VRVAKPANTRKASRHAAALFRLRLVIMAKVPVMGRVKTRLAAEVGATQAVRFYRATLTAVAVRLGRDPRWHTSLAVAPDTGIASPALPRHVPRVAQGGGDLGSRMQRVMDRRERGPLIIVGTDIPAITPAHIAEAFRHLRGRDAVIGPAPDGGYWLVGLRRSPRIPKPFAGVRWSSEATLADTIANLGWSAVGRAAQLADVDNAVELAACRGHFGRIVRPRA
jgi:uncharacterized protein